MTTITAFFTLTVAAALFSWVGGPYVTPHPVTRLETGVQKEEIEHDWNSASLLYLGLMQPDVPAAVRMEAEIRYARCQLKQGKPADAEKSLHTLADRLRGERLPDSKPRIDTATGETRESRLEAVMKEIESSEGVDRTRLVEAAIDGMARTLGQNSGYVSPQEIATITGTFSGVGAVLGGGGAKPVTIMDIVPGSAAEKAGLAKGTELLEIDGKTPFALGGRLEEVVKAVRGPEGSTVKLRLKMPGGEIREPTLTRARVDLKEPDSCTPVFGFAIDAANARYWLDEDAGIAGVAVHFFDPDCAAKLQKILTSAPFTDGKVKALVLDLWGNGGGSAEEARKIADLFLKEGVIVQEKTKEATKMHKADAAEMFPGVPLAVLVNRGTASSGEVIAAALQDNRRAVSVGERTYGRGEVQVLKNLPGGGAIKVPFAEFLRPSGAALERREGMNELDVWGVTPELTVPLDANPEDAPAVEAQHRAVVLAAVLHLKKANAPK